MANLEGCSIFVASAAAVATIATATTVATTATAAKQKAEVAVLAKQEATKKAALEAEAEEE